MARPADSLTRAYGLHGSTAVVTGARSGIGRASALALAGAGADVVLWGRSADGMDGVADEVRGFGVQARVVAADLADLDAVERIATELVASGDVDIRCGTKNRDAVIITTSTLRCFDCELD